MKRFSMVLALFLCLAPTGWTDTNTWNRARLMAINEDRTALVLDTGARALNVTVKSKPLQAALKNHDKDDLVTATVIRENGETVLDEIRTVTVPVGKRFRLLVMVVCGALMVLGTALFLHGHDTARLMVGADNRYSNSKFQMLLWFGVLVMSYMAAGYLRWHEGGGAFIGGINLPQNLLVLSGISTFTLAAAKGIVTGNIARGKITKNHNPGQPQLVADLLCDDTHQPDIADFQMTVVTLLAVAVYLIQIFHFLGNIELSKTVTIPDVDTTILATFGFSQGAYLMKKYVAHDDKPPGK